VALRTQVAEVLPHPSLRLRWAAADEPDETGAPAGIAADTELVGERRRAS